MIQIIPIPAFQDNYIWLLFKNQHAVVIDPGDASPVLNTLDQYQLTLDTILITHHHSDHIGGVDEILKNQQARVYAPASGQYEFPHLAVNRNSQISLEHPGLTFSVIEVPGHTLDHVAYYGANSLFCGDALFGAGCGRLFEGTPEQAYQSLQKLACLPGSTQVYPAHEYTEHNIDFALTLEPGNPALIERQALTRQLRAGGQPSLPSSMALELATNPFLRCDQRDIQLAAGIRSSRQVDVFAAIRGMRNHF